MSEAFDPRKYLTKLSRRMRTPDGQWKNVKLDYLEVKWRLLWLRTEHPDAIIRTKLEDHDPEAKLAIFSAHVHIPGRGEATGWGSETAEDWRDYIEKAESKALGRALAALGFGTQFCEDFEFSAGNTEKVVDAPVRTPAKRSEPPEKPEYPTEPIASEPQVRMLISTAQRIAGCTRDEAIAALTREFKTTPECLTVRQANDALAALKARAANN